ncbi:hypothetical protein [Microbispora sp. GKU 823]|uniref:hypothetical protein n=1 Tax=Microbispora sp. GKU 823 TaxID=1652100 RepID=UPI002117C325|nr:hypothetical protein [Microbispora sp. GKU 823]
MRPILRVTGRGRVIGCWSPLPSARILRCSSRRSPGPPHPNSTTCARPAPRRSARSWTPVPTCWPWPAARTSARRSRGTPRGRCARGPRRPGRPGGSRPAPVARRLGRWLLERAHASGRDLPALRFEAAGFDAPPAECAALGRRLAESARRVALLVMGDGSARRTEKAPGYVHPGAVPYDEMLAAALASGDTGRLLGLDPDEARELWAAGRAAFQVLGGAARGAPRPAASELLYDDAPYGVGYFVARWTW